MEKMKESRVGGGGRGERGKGMHKQEGSEKCNCYTGVNNIEQNRNF